MSNYTLVEGPDSLEYAISLDSGCYVDMIPESLDSEATEARTICFWYRYNGTEPDVDYIFEWLNEDGTNAGTLRIDDTRAYLTYGYNETWLSTELRDGEWHFLAFVFRNDGYVKTYIDGTETTNTDSGNVTLGGGGLTAGYSKLQEIAHSGLIYYDFRVYLREIETSELELLRQDMLTNSGDNTLPYADS